jgi:catabolite regulation protein CreA
MCKIKIQHDFNAKTKQERKKVVFKKKSKLVLKKLKVILDSTFIYTH